MITVAYEVTYEVLRFGRWYKLKNLEKIGVSNEDTPESIKENFEYQARNREYSQIKNLSYILIS